MHLHDKITAKLDRAEKRGAPEVKTGGCKGSEEQGAREDFPEGAAFEQWS